MATKFVQSALTKLLAMFARQPIQLCACLALSAFIWFGGDFGAAPTFATLQREAALQVAQATGSHAPAGNTSIVGAMFPTRPAQW